MQLSQRYSEKVMNTILNNQKLMTDLNDLQGLCDHLLAIIICYVCSMQDRGFFFLVSRWRRVLSSTWPLTHSLTSQLIYYYPMIYSSQLCHNSEIGSSNQMATRNCESVNWSKQTIQPSIMAAHSGDLRRNLFVPTGRSVLNQALLSFGEKDYLCGPVKLLIVWPWGSV